MAQTEPKLLTQLSGKVIDKDNKNEPILGANIIVRRNGTVLTGAEADIDGLYSISLEPGTYDIECSMVGYPNVIINNVFVEKDKTKEFNFEMEGAIDETIYIHYYHRLIDVNDPTSRTIFSGSEIRRMPVR